MKRKLVFLAVLLLLPVLIGGVSTNSSVDEHTGAISVVDYPHHELHAGKAFVVHAENTIASGASINITFTTPNTLRWLHAVPRARCSGEANLTINEGVTAASGTSFTPVNRNRNSAEAAGPTDVVITATVSDKGTEIFAEHFGAGQNRGGESRGTEEWLLKQNTKYSFIVLSEAASNDCELILDWYEHTGKD
jgi:hypothetical protein